MLKVHAQRLGDVTILHLQGRIVTGETKVLQDAVSAASGFSAVVLNFARVTGIDAGGLGVLLQLRQQLQASRVEFRLMNVTLLVHQVLEITRLNSVFEVIAEADVVSLRSRPQVEFVAEAVT